MSQWLTAKAHNLLVCLDDCGLYLFSKFWKFLGESDKKNKNLTLAHQGNPSTTYSANSFRVHRLPEVTNGS